MSLRTGKVLWYSNLENRGVIQDQRTKKEFIFRDRKSFRDNQFVTYEALSAATAKVIMYIMDPITSRIH